MEFEFLYKLNEIPRLEALPEGGVLIRGGAPLVKQFVKALGICSETSEGEFICNVPATRASIAKILHKSQKKLLQGALSVARNVPLPFSEVLIHELDNGSFCVLGKPSAEAMVEMQQIGGKFTENIVLGGDKLMGWTFDGVEVGQLEQLLSVSLTPYRGPPAVTAEVINPTLSTNMPEIRFHKRARKSLQAVAQVTPASSSEKAPKKACKEAAKKVLKKVPKKAPQKALKAKTSATDQADA